MANQYIPSFFEHPSDREARKRAHVRDAQVYHNIGRRHTQQMRHWGRVAGMGGSGGGGTLRRMGQKEQHRATLDANNATWRHIREEADIARVRQKRQRRHQSRKHDQRIQQIEKDRGSDADVARRAREFQEQYRQQQQARAAQAEALRRQRLGVEGRKREDRDAIYNKIRKNGETPELLRALRAVDPDHYDMWVAPFKRGNRPRSTFGIPITGPRRGELYKSSVRESDTRTAGASRRRVSAYEDMIKSATQHRSPAVPPPPPPLNTAAAAEDNIDDDDEADAGGGGTVVRDGPDGYASLGEDDDDEEGGGGDGTPIQPSRTLSPKRGIVVHARTKGHNPLSKRTMRRRTKAAAADRARRRTRTGIGPGGIVVHSSNPNPAARDALHARVRENLDQVSAAPAKKWHGLWGGHRRRTHRRKRTHKRRRKRRRTQRIKNRKKKRRRRNTRK